MGKLLKFMPGFMFLVFCVALLILTATPFAVLMCGGDVLDKYYVWPITATVYVIGMSVIYNDLYEDIIFRTNKQMDVPTTYLFPGPAGKKLANKIIGFVTLIIIATVMFNSAHNQIRNNARTERTELDLYKEYYKCTETLLDSLYIDEDHPILESDVGVDYANAKFEVDEYEPEN